MLKAKSRFYGILLALSVSGLALTACSTQGASRYGDAHVVTPPVPCGTVMVPCGQVIEYHPVQVTPPPYLVPAPCPTAPCPVPQPPVIDPPYEPPVVVDPPYEPPVIVDPPYEPPVLPPPPPPPPPPVTCPPGTIPGYGGQDCIPITVPRK